MEAVREFSHKNHRDARSLDNAQRCMVTIAIVTNGPNFFPQDQLFARSTSRTMYNSIAINLAEVTSLRNNRQR